MGTGNASAEEIKREARVVGFSAGSAPTLEAVERRRRQLWALGIGLLFAVSVGVAFVLTARPAADGSVGTPAVLPIALGLLSVGFGVYTIEKEFHLRRLMHLLTNQRALTTDLEKRLNEMGLLLEAGKAMNSVLELPAVLETILRSAIDVLSGKSGSIMLLETPDELVTVLARGSDVIDRRVRVGSGIVGQVAESRTALLVRDRSEFPGMASADGEPCAVCVPLVSRNVFFGVLNVHAGPEGRYTEYDLQVASLFAEQAAGAIANARLYETERMRVDRAELAHEFRSLHEAEGAHP